MKILYCKTIEKINRNVELERSTDLKRDFISLLCLNQVQYGLVDEANQLEATILALKQKLAQAQ